jgi:hypothetical protein
MHDNKCDTIVINKMPFNGLKEFYPLIHREALFFKEVGESRIKWWHGWLKGFNLVPGIVEGYLECVTNRRVGEIPAGTKLSVLQYNEDCYVNLETETYESQYIDKSHINFGGLFIDIGGEELMIL